MNTPTPRTDAVAKGYTPKQVKTEDCKGFVPVEFARQLEQELNEAKKTMATYGGIEDLLCPEFEGVDDLVECFRLLKEERNQLEQELNEAKELLREIRDNEVNAQDEADKFLRDHVPSELSKARAVCAELVTDGNAVTLVESLHRVEAERDQLRKALEKINKIRNSIIAHQSCNFSEHVYPLVAALNEAGIEGMSYPDALAYFGPVTERCAKAEAENTQLRKVADELALRLEISLAICERSGLRTDWNAHESAIRDDLNNYSQFPHVQERKTK